MKGYTQNIEAATLEHTNFRTVLYTGNHLQLVLMTLQPGEEIGVEVHAEHDQFFRFEAGAGTVYIDGVAHEVGDGDAVIVPAGAEHNVVNTGDTDALKLYTLYAPPEHRHDVVHATKAEAEADDEHFDSQTTE
jgi:mannose-6-phosphate isomerase-like protein (cupin superfamily)